LRDSADINFKTPWAVVKDKVTTVFPELTDEEKEKVFVEFVEKRMAGMNQTNKKKALFSPLLTILQTEGSDEEEGALKEEKLAKRSRKRSRSPEDRDRKRKGSVSPSRRNDDRSEKKQKH
jgi:hypothetical protein